MMMFELTLKRIKMKKTLILLSLIALVASCAHNRIRFVKHTKKEVVKVDQGELLLIETIEALVFADVLLIPNDVEREIIEPKMVVSDDIVDTRDKKIIYSNWSSAEPPDSTYTEVNDSAGENEFLNAEPDEERGNDLWRSIMRFLFFILVGIGIFFALLIVIAIIYIFWWIFTL